MLPTAIGLITRRHKKLKSLSVLYAGFPILGMLLAFMACTFSGISLSSSATFTEVICDLGSVISFALLTALLVIIASIAEKCRTAPPRLWFCWRELYEAEPDFELKADYIEHRFEARAMLPPICDALRNRLFCFYKISDTELTP